MTYQRYIIHLKKDKRLTNIYILKIYNYDVDANICVSRSQDDLRE